MGDDGRGVRNLREINEHRQYCELIKDVDGVHTSGGEVHLDIDKPQADCFGKDGDYDCDCNVDEEGA